MSIPSDGSLSPVLVTGAAGLLGRYVVRELLEHGTGVRGFDLRKAAEPIDWRIGDITDLDALRQAAEGCVAMLHLAGRPNPRSGNADDILRVNTLGTWNAFRAAEEMGLRRVVFCSSDSVIGYTVREGMMIPPDYLPVDLSHPLRPTDAYALSKQLGEDICRSFARRGIEAVAMRAVFVAYPEMEGEIRSRARDPDNYRGQMAGGPSSAGGGPVFNHIDPRDLARAFRLALEASEIGTSAMRFEAFFLAAQNTLSPEPTVARMHRLLGKRVEIRDADLYARNPYASTYDLTPARERLGFVPQFDQRHLIAAGE